MPSTRKVPFAPPEHKKQPTKQQPKRKSACLSEPSWEQEHATVQLSKSRDSAHNESPVGFLSYHEKSESWARLQPQRD
jgi:hypothetical protein